MPPFQQKGDGGPDENKGPNQNDVDMSHSQVRQQEDNCGKKEQWPGDAAMKGAVPRPIGNAAYSHRKKNSSGGGRMKAVPVNSDEAEHSPCDQRCNKPVAHRRWRTATSMLSLCHNSRSAFRLDVCLTIRAMSPRQHLPEGFFTSHAQFPAFTSSEIRSAIVERPVSVISFSMFWRLNPKQ